MSPAKAASLFQQRFSLTKSLLDVGNTTFKYTATITMHPGHFMDVLLNYGES